MRALKMSGTVAGHWKWQWPNEMIIKADPLSTTREAGKELNIDRSTAFEANWNGEKAW